MKKLFTVVLLCGIAWGAAYWHDEKVADAWNCGFSDGMDREIGKKLEQNERCDWSRSTNAYDCGDIDGRNVSRALHILIVEPGESSLPKKYIEKRPERCERLYWLERISWRMLV